MISISVAISIFFPQALPKVSTSDLWTDLVARYAISGSEFLAEEVGPGSDPKQPMFNWGIGVTLSAENALARLDPSRLGQLNRTLRMCEKYWNPVGPVGGFDVVPGTNQPNDRYYDDNAWMVLALVESFEITGERHWLRLAKRSLEYVLSGEDAKLGGGIYWKERSKTSKNTCSNGPGAAACLAVFKHVKDQQLLERAKAIYGWTKKNLQAPDSLYWDNINLNASIDRTKWSYNSALMLRTAKELFAITMDSQYERDSAQLETACIQKWVQSDGTIDDELQFAHLLFENLDPKNFDAKKSVARLLSGRGADGFFGKRWGKPFDGRHQLIHQAAAIRALAIYDLRRFPK